MLVPGSYYDTKSFDHTHMNDGIQAINEENEFDTEMIMMRDLSIKPSNQMKSHTRRTSGELNLLCKGSVILLLYVVVIPFVSPYGIGIHAGSAAPTSLKSGMLPRSILSFPTTVGKLSNLKATSKVEDSITDATTTTTTTTIHGIDKNQNNNLSNNLSKNHDYDKMNIQSNDLGGECNASLISRLLFLYATPLLRLSSKKTLESHDVLQTSDKNKMENVVPELDRIYQKCRTKAQRRLELLRSSTSQSDTTSTTTKHGRRKKKNKKDLIRRINDKIATSESLILAKAIVIHQKKMLLLTGILRLLNTFVQAFPAILVARLLRLIEAGEAHHPSKAIQAAMALVGVLLIKMITENQYFHHVVKGAINIRGSLGCLIFDKSLRLSISSDGGVSRLSSGATTKGTEKSSYELGTGGVLNLMQTDTSIIEMTALQIHTIWDGLLQIAIYSTLLFKYLGPSVLWGIGLLLVAIPTNSGALRILNRLNVLENKAKDSRTKRTSEAISNMKLLKLQGWEKYFQTSIEENRKEELKRHSNRGTVRAVNQAVSNAIPALVLVVTLTAYRRTGRPIVASTIFTAISLFNQLRFPLFFYPMVIDSISNGKNALKRISSYLCQEELTPYLQKLPKDDNDDGGSIELRNGNFLWSSAKYDAEGKLKGSAVNPALCGVELSVKPGEVVAVVGTVGSGKTALIKALLGELEPVPRIVVDESLDSRSYSVSERGTSLLDIPSVSVKGDIAYCAQEAWLSRGTIKDAILFGRDYDEKKYRDALYIAGLDDDIVDSAVSKSVGTLTHDTEVGESGLSLSGGQRARVQLARAFYDDSAGVYLLDDPLSALDATVGSIVFKRVIEAAKNRNAAVIFVTNDPALPSRCDRVVLMVKLKDRSCSGILDVGTYDQLIKRHDLRRITIHDISNESDDDKKDVFQKKIFNAIANSPIEHEECEGSTCHADPDSLIAVKHDVDLIEIKELEGKSIQNSTEAIDFKSQSVASIDESMQTGAVPISTYLSYIKAVRNPALVLAAFSCYIISNGAQFLQQLIVSKWTEVGTDGALAATLGAKYLNYIVWAAVNVSIFLFLRSYVLMKVGIRASEFFHSKMLSSVFKAPVSFFDATPSGQLLSRFGKELDTVDRSVPDGIGSLLYCFLQIFMTALGLAGVVSPVMLLPLIVISFFYSSAMKQYRPAARDLKRLETKNRSPIYTHFGDALRGSEVIRSFPMSPNYWRSQNKYLVNNNLNVFQSVKALDRWLSIKLETLGNVVVFAAAISSVVLTRSGTIKSGSAGWGLTQSLAITGLLTWAVRVLTDLESQMMSVMRVSELTDINTSAENVKKMPREKETPGEELPSLQVEESKELLPVSPVDDSALRLSGWPWEGGVTFQNVSMKYNPNSRPVLRNVNIVVKPGTTLGIVGRTGSGKSSLLLTMFRIFEIEKDGSILIDGVDIRSLSLETLRNAISIIPQNPVLFSGSLLYNLDATGRCTEDEAWAALEAASLELSSKFRSSPGGLNTEITEGGKNLSAGQRQLICLARALLRGCKILLLDEATSSVDSNTDAEVQDTIQREFATKGVTVITVAHRLETVLGSDMILVLGNGRVLEFDKPRTLAMNPKGHLRRLIDADRIHKKSGELELVK